MSFGLVDANPKAIPLVPHDEHTTGQQLAESSSLTRNLCEQARFTGKWGQVFVETDGSGSIQSVWVGQDSRPDDPRSWVQLFADLASRLPGGCYRCDRMRLDAATSEQALIGWGLAHYRFDEYKTVDHGILAQLAVPTDQTLDRVNAQLESIFLARDLINRPASDLGPDEMCDVARKLADRFDAQLNIIRGDTLLKENYPAIHAVGRGSHRQPALIDMNWGDPALPKLTLVGKGVVFDTGGLNLKAAAGMRLMKKDMGGGALVLALSRWVMSQNLPVRLRMLVPVVENSPGRDAYRPSDVIATRKGLRIEIDNTDAEGRVILCDALAEAVSDSPDLIIDMATLTGAARVALGPDLAAFYTPRKDLAEALKAASEEVADPVWEMPLWQPYRSYLESTTGHLANSSTSKFGGSITAAVFLHEFVRPFEAWLHMDIYGWNPNNAPGFPVGGEATAFRAVARLLDQRYRS